MDDDREAVANLTTPNFTGMIAVVAPQASWATRWERLGEADVCVCVKGVFAIGRRPRSQPAVCLLEQTTHLTTPQQTNTIKSQSTDKAVPGCYALAINEDAPTRLRDIMENRNMRLPARR
jgi:hypothetical protein